MKNRIAKKVCAAALAGSHDNGTRSNIRICSRNNDDRCNKLR